MRRKRSRHETHITQKQKHTSGSSSSSKTKKTKKKHTVLRKIRNVVLTIIFLSLVTGIGIGAGMYISIEKEIRDMNVQNLAINYSSFVYYTDRNGNSHELEKLFDDENRIWLDSDRIPQVMKDAIVSIEDERFYSHSGVDIKRTGGAFVGWVMEKMGKGRASYGGSTLTQQVIKNITMEKDRTPMRKVREMMRAVALERQLSKDEILTVYLNLIFLGNGCHGIEAASNTYYSKSAIDLTIPEAALIAGITNRPSYYDPLKNPENALKRRNVILEKMYELEKISESEYNEAVNTPLNLKSSYKEIRSKLYSYFVDNVINEIISDLQTEKGYSESYAEQITLNGGLKIYTTMDYDIQQDIEAVYENKANFPSSKLQSAMVIIDPYTGEIKGMVGGVGEKTDSRGLNRATQTFRQPGSAIKPLSVYSPAIDTGKLSAASIVQDAKLTIGKWSPKNAYRGFKGYIPVRKALEVSSNTAAVRVVQDSGVDTAYDYMTNKYRFTTLTDSDRDLSPMGLGGLTNGVSPQEMAAAYAAFANGGTYYIPHSYTKVVDNSGKVLLEKDGTPKRAIKESTAYIMTNLLSSVITGPSGTARDARLSDMPVSGKTGTTNNDKDKWFIGYTPYYVGAVWTGFDQPSSLRSAGISTNVSVNIWKKVMTRVHEGLKTREFSVPNSVSKVLICTSTGHLASKGCHYAKYEYFADGAAPKKYCRNRVGPSGGSSGGSSKKPSKADPTEDPEDTDNLTNPEITDDPDDAPLMTSAPVDDTPPDKRPAPTDAPTTDDNISDVPQQPVTPPTQNSDPVISLDE